MSNSLVSIGDEAFRACSGLASIVIPNSVVDIGEGAFFSCWYLESITIPGSVISMGENVLYGCGRLTTINTTETIYREYLSELNYLPDVEINY
jgi:hypothetical protein